MLVINFFGAPGAGKSTGAAYVFAKLKMAGVNAELVTEFAKDKVWEEALEPFKNQAYIFGEQYFRMTRCKDKVDVLITDSPLPLSVFYNKNDELKKSFTKTVMDVFNSYNNINFYVKRTKSYNPIGRLHTEKESNDLATKVINMLESNGIVCNVISGDIEDYDKAVNYILRKLQKIKYEEDKLYKDIYSCLSNLIASNIDFSKYILEERIDAISLTNDISDLISKKYYEIISQYHESL